LLVGGKLFAAMKRSIGAGEGSQGDLGVLILAASAVSRLASTRASWRACRPRKTFAFEHAMAQLLGMEERRLAPRSAGSLPVEGSFAPLDGAGLVAQFPPLEPASSSRARSC
jgi:hypothetical protein